MDSAGKRDEESAPSEDFTFLDSNEETKSVNVDREALYMIDVDLVKLLPEAYADFQRNFKLPGILPGGSHCMMNAVSIVCIEAKVTAIHRHTHLFVWFNFHIRSMPVVGHSWAQTCESVVLVVSYDRFSLLNFWTTSSRFQIHHSAILIHTFSSGWECRCLYQSRRQHCTLASH